MEELVDATLDTLAEGRYYILNYGSSEEESSEDESGTESSEDEEVSPVSAPVDPTYILCSFSCNNHHPPEKIFKCTGEHPICFSCARAYTQTQLGEDFPTLKCVHPSCNETYPGAEVLQFIDLSIFFGVPREHLDAKTGPFGLTGLVDICPYCKSVVGCKNEVVLTCTNGSCEKSSCRKCRKATHGAKTCEEAYKESMECGDCLRVYPPLEIVRCEDSHPFCLEYATNKLSKDVSVPTCLDPICDKVFPGKEVLRFLDLEDLNKKTPRESLEARTSDLGIRGLVELCPYCESLVECQDEEMLTCSNMPCGRGSCRRCKKAAHSAKTCEEAYRESTECGHCLHVYPPVEIARCEDGHPFCLEYAINQLGKKVSVPTCLDPICDKVFPGKEVLRFLDLEDLNNNTPRESLAAKVDNLGIRGLVEFCPYCESLVQCENEVELQCARNSCGKSSCRRCKKAAHGAKTCEEAYKESTECGHCLHVYPPVEIARCEGGHPFCLEATREYTKNRLGEDVSVLNCLDPACGETFPGKEILRFLDLEVFNSIPRESLEIKIDDLGIRGLVEFCPYCESVVACGDQVVVNCANRSCGRSSCRKCKKTAHGEKTCEEAYKESTECGHCLRTYPPSEIVRCEVGHPFCLEFACECAKHKLDMDSSALKCLDTTCSRIFSGAEVLRFLDLEVFRGIPREIIETKIDGLGIRGLVEFCLYCERVALCEDAVVNCANSSCGRSSCMKCKKATHDEKTCEEAYKESTECGHCLRTYPPSEIVRCEVGHPFCLEVARECAKNQLGMDSSILKCLDTTCNKTFPGAEVLRFLDLEALNSIPREIIETKIDGLGIRGLVEFCLYCESVALCEDAVVNCANSSCGKSTCKKCKKAAHDEKTCEEAYKESTECGHCLRAYPPLEIVRCEVGHPFCLEAARQYSRNQLGMDSSILKCLDTICGKIFPGNEALRFLDFDALNNVPRECLETKINDLGIKELVDICENCGTVVGCGPLELSIICVCTNTACKKITCRKCRKDAHGSLSCEEEESRMKQLAVADREKELAIIIRDLIAAEASKGRMRLYMEKMLTDAIFKQCKNCETKLLKKNGKNQMQCGRCEMLQCYLCDESIAGGGHFGVTNATRRICQLYGDSFKLDE